MNRTPAMPAAVTNATRTPKLPSISARRTRSRIPSLDCSMKRPHHGLRERVRLALIEGSFGVLVALVTAAGMAGVLFIGVRDIQAGTLTLGNFLLVMGYLAQLYLPLKTISKKVANMQTHLAGAERAFALLDEAPDVIERPNARPLARASGAMAFRRVSFAYEE